MKKAWFAKVLRHCELEIWPLGTVLMDYDKIVPFSRDGLDGSIA